MTDSTKSQLLKVARHTISELIQDAKLEQGQSIEVKYKDAYIYLKRTGYFGDEMDEYSFQYSKVVGDKIYELDSFCYDKYHRNKKHIHNWYFDHTTRHTFRKIKPWMNLKNLIFTFEQFHPLEL